MPDEDPLPTTTLFGLGRDMLAVAVFSLVIYHLGKAVALSREEID